MKLLAYLAATIAGLLFAASPVCAALAIWTVGPDAGRWGWTAFLFFAVGSFGSLAAALWIDDLR